MSKTGKLYNFNIFLICTLDKKKPKNKKIVAEGKRKFRSVSGCVELVFVLTKLVEKYRDRKFNIVFMGLEKAFVKVYRDEQWRIWYE